MSEEKKKRNKIIGISIGILVVLLVVISSTYAYWQITRSQQDPNSIVSQCLSLEMANQSGTFGLEDVYPMEDSEGLSKKGFTFDVINNCDRDIAYVIGMDSIALDLAELGVDGYLLDSSIKISIDNTTPKIYDDLEAIDHIGLDDTYTIRNSKEINTATVPAKVGNEPGKNTHNIKAWIDINSSSEESNKAFSGRIFITGGQFISDDNPIAHPTDESCFTMNGGEIIGYDESCGTSVSIPARVNDVPVTTIDTDAFRGVVARKYYGEGADMTEQSSLDTSGAIGALVINNYNEGDTIEWSNLMTLFDYAIIYSDDKAVEDALRGVANENQDIYFDNSTTQNVPENKNNHIIIYMADLMGNILGKEYVNTGITIDDLDLSMAYNLQKIEPRAFTNYDPGINNKTAFQGQMDNKPVSLTSLKFGKTTNKLEIGFGAFNGIDVDNLIVYSNFDAMDIDYANDTNYTIGFFSGSQIDNLTIEYVEGYPVIGGSQNNGIGADVLYSYIIANQVNVGEGITTLSVQTFAGWRDLVKINNISLPSTIKHLESDSLETVDNINFVSGNCNGVVIASDAWSDSAVVTPNTCVLGQNVN